MKIIIIIFVIIINIIITIAIIIFITVPGITKSHITVNTILVLAIAFIIIYHP